VISSQQDREAVRETVTGVTHDIDHRRWQSLRARFADTVVVDYTSLFSGEVQRQNADDLVDGWRQLLTPLSATQHLLGPICVLIGERTTATCHVRGYHQAKGLPGGEMWMVAGHYEFELERDWSGWRIHGIKFQLFYQTGNLKLLEQTASRPR
jgi:hypothetical protein